MNNVRPESQGVSEKYGDVLKSMLKDLVDQPFVDQAFEEAVPKISDFAKKSIEDSAKQSEKSTKNSAEKCPEPFKKTSQDCASSIPYVAIVEEVNKHVNEECVREFKNEAKQIAKDAVDVSVDASYSLFN